MAIAVVVAALGYCVDIYDLVLFNVVRHRSLLDVGIAPDQIQPEGIRLLNLQLLGMLAGGFIWGVLGDYRGRLSVLMGSILLYSAANLANAYVESIEAYEWLRVAAGIGLAGELGAGVTLVSELMSRRGRGWGVMIVGAVGVVGAVAAGLVGEHARGIPALGLAADQGWRTAYLIGGIGGLLLLLLRVSLRESGMFHSLSSSSAKRGLLVLLRSPQHMLRYLMIVLAGAPIWFTLGIIIGLSPQIAAAMGLPPDSLPRPGVCVSLYYAAAIFGDLSSGTLSQLLHSRRRAMLVFVCGTALGVAAVLILGSRSLTWFYGGVTCMGFFSGYWIVMITTSSELFGTNVRATVTTTVPNMVRASAVPMTLAFDPLSRSVGHVQAASMIAAVVFAAAALSMIYLPETYGRDLDYTEE
ncbi:MAG: MFS transporter [Phycisphaerales bacterium]|nr:MFS transporter [Phycisphaerales bacterium]